MEFDPHVLLTWALFAADFCARLYFCYRILQRRLPVGSTWAWLGLILLFPLAGTAIYLYLGEYRLSWRRQKSQQAAASIIGSLIHDRFHASGESHLTEPSLSLEKTARSLFQAPLLSGNDIDLITDAPKAFEKMIADIDRAKISCDMEFYIWSDGGLADDFGHALIRAAKRGVCVRVLVDQIGSAAFLRGPRVIELREGGVEVKAALPSSVFRALIARPDLRIHRKILVIDGSIAYTGSLNLADPEIFKQEVGVGEWVDAACRVTGPAVEALGLVFLVDWTIEGKTEFAAELERTKFADISERKDCKIQCLPSGPAVKDSLIEQILITAIYSARRELILTTPYFVPSEALAYALTAAARRGVKVTLIVPARVDSRLIQNASQAFLRDLHDAGVQVALFKRGLLHTKSVTVDGELCLFGSLNLDPRSLRINFEITLVIYDPKFTEATRALQLSYLKDCQMFVEVTKTRGQALREDLVRLISPLL
jgi:cardiolipin synthase